MFQQQSLFLSNHFKFDEKIIKVFMLQVVDLTYILNV